MSNLAIVKGLALNLLAEERELAIAFYGTQIKNISKADIADQLFEIIKETHATKGTAFNAKDGVAQSKAICNDLKMYFGTLTIEEVRICFFRGVRGVFGEVYGLNVATYFVWLRNFLNCTDRMEAKKKQNAYRLESEKPRELTQQERDEIMIKGIKEAYETVKSGKDYRDLGNSIYNWLDKRKKIPFDPKRKKDIVEMARVQLKAEKERDLASNTDISERRKIKMVIDELEIKNTGELIVESKKIALVVFLKDQIEMDISVDEFLK